MTRYLTERGIESTFVGGLRVTTPETLDAVLKVFAGSVNHELVAAINRAGALAVGISGIDSFLVEAEQMDPALGAVGRVTKSNPGLLHLLTANAYVPVVACVAGDRQGQVYNVNADQMAVACAARFRRRATDLPHRRRRRDGRQQAGPRAPRCRRQPATDRRWRRHRRHAGQTQRRASAPGGRRGAGADRARRPRTDVLDRILAGEEIGTRMVLVVLS